MKRAGSRFLRFRNLLSGCMLLLFFQLLQAAPPPIRIMPLGASITKGFPVPGGYRDPLYHLLTDAGYTVDFVGNERSNGSTNLPDPDHEGHTGYRMDSIDARFNPWADRVAEPDIIVLQVGANDFAQNQDLDHATNRMDHLISRITSNRPQARLIVTGLFLRTDYPDVNERMETTYNPYVPGIVARHAARGERVWFLDLHSVMTASDLSQDGLHPNSVGYCKMATNIFEMITNLITPLGVTNEPAITYVAGGAALNEVTVSFNKPVLPDAANTNNFTISGGLSVLSATLDPISQRDVKLMTSPQQPSSSYTVSVSNVRELAGSHRAIAAGSSMAFQSAPVPGALHNVPEATNYTLVYSLNIPDKCSFNYNAIPYDVDNHLGVHDFSRIAYYLELQPRNGPLEFVWVSMDAFTDDAGRIGVPARATGAFFQQSVSNMNVFSSVRGVKKGTNMPGGFLEFWPSAYTAQMAIPLPNASGLLYDFSDQPTTGDFGSMQVHNAADAQTIFAFNHWADNSGSAIDVGIGNCGTSYPDWTLAANAGHYSRKLLQVFVLPKKHAQ